MATARVYSPLASVSTSATLAIAFTGTQPVAGDKLIAVFWNFTGDISPTVSSVKDNATSQNTFTSVVSNASDQGGSNFQGVFCYELDLPANATWSGNYTATVTFANSAGNANGACAAYIGVATGNATATNNATGTSTSANSGNITPSGSGLYVGGETDANAAPPGAPGSGFTNEVSGGSQPGVFSDLTEGSGTKSANWAITSAVWSAIVAFFPDSTAGGVVRVFRAQQRSAPPRARLGSRVFRPPFTPPPGQVPIVSYAYSAN